MKNLKITTRKTVKPPTRKVGADVLVPRGLAGGLTAAAVAGEMMFQLDANAGHWNPVAVMMTALPVMMVAATVTMTWMAEGHGKLSKALMAGGIISVLVLGSALVTFQGITRTEGNLGAAVADASTNADELVGLKADLVAAKKESAAYRLKADVECGKPAANNPKGRPSCGVNSVSFDTKADKADVRAKEAQARIDALQPNATVLGFEKAGAALHVDAAILETYVPMGLPIVLQALGLLFGHVAFRPFHKAKAATWAAPAKPACLSNEVCKSRTEAALMKVGGKIGSQKELAEVAGMDPSCISRGCELLEKQGRILRHRDGKRVALALVA